MVLGRMGVAPSRFRTEWISAAEGDKHVQVLIQMLERPHPIPKEELVEEIERPRAQLERRARRMHGVSRVDQALEYSRALEPALEATAAGREA